MTVTGNVDVQPQAELNVGFDSALPQPSSTIDGNVYVGKGATLVASSGISLDLTLGGNIEANQCNTVLLGPVIIGVMSIFRTARERKVATKQPKLAAISPATTILGASQLSAR